ncbi:hypothetical protein A0H81_06135 [Grifola frondosa]|uniref:Uncharacterized protein n=1 Tax=Grifola frondosa TaxID=5627 RepID=A0A1C7MBL2_GRIFR|nr:hypothetical protein A0H81_06135 [Grifola frondosa]
MGFFKRLLSIGSSKKSKKTKKTHNSASVDAEGRIVSPCEQDADDNANRLLRSSSSRYAVVAEVDYASLPPLPHPINQVTSTPPLTPARSTSSTQPRGTYVVKVHGRAEKAHRINFTTLLGDPESDDVRRNSFTEGDISWAERFLGEHLGNNSPFSSTSSLALPTPKDALYHNEPSEPHVITNNTYSTIGHDSGTNYPAISSMEVELSASEAEGGEAMPSSPYKQVEPKTPQRASEVFSFLTARRKSLREQVARSRSPSLTPSPVTPANTGPNTNTNSSPQSVAPFSLESPTSTPTSFSDTQSQYSQAQIKTATLAKLSAAPAIYSPFSVSSQALTRETSISPHKLVCQSPVENLRRPSTGSYVETPLPSSSKLPINRIPRGPRPRPTSTPSNLDPFRADLPLENMQHVPAPSRWQNLRDALDDPRGKAREALTSIPVRRHRRTTSRATSSSSHSPAVNLDSDKDDTDDDTSKVSGPSKIARFRRPETKHQRQ